MSGWEKRQLNPWVQCGARLNVQDRIHRGGLEHTFYKRGKTMEILMNQNSTDNPKLLLLCKNNTWQLRAIMHQQSAHHPACLTFLGQLSDIKKKKKHYSFHIPNSLGFRGWNNLSKAMELPMALLALEWVLLILDECLDSWHPPRGNTSLRNVRS